jgi:hypothetical protein
VREDSSDRLDPLCGERCHQLADGGSEHLPHFAAWNVRRMTAASSTLVVVISGVASMLLSPKLSVYLGCLP